MTIDGLNAPAELAPDSPRAVAEVLAEAAERGHGVIPVGGATALALGNPPERWDCALSTGKLGGIIDYEPTDLVLSVGAGAKLGDVQAVLGEHGQHLPIDPPGGAEATIGGLIATGLAGPRRLSAGTLRDLLIGISVAHPSGTITKAGGMVVKNVTGFDLSRVYHGSLGTLGVIVSANFKVLPLPRADVTLLLVTSSLAAALDAAGRVRASRVEPAALESALIDGQWLTAVRLAGHATTVRSLTDDTRNLLDGDVELLDKEASAGWWRSYLDGQSLTAADDEAVIRCSVRPRDIATFALGIDAEMARLGVAVPLLAASVGLGSVVARLRLSDGDADRLAEIQTVLLALAENATILAAPAAWKRGLDVWGRVPPTLAIMRELKEQFDPRRVLNPGRFAGGI